MPRAASTSRALVGALAAALGGGTGCQTFIGVEDVNGHLPRLDGMYLLAIQRVRVNGGATDVIRLKAMAALDAEARTLDVSFLVLDFDSDATVAEGSLTGIEFPADSAVASFPFTLQVPSDAVDPDNAPTDDDRMIDVADMLLRAEAEYSFCAHPSGQQTSPSFGTVLIATGAPLPTGADIDTDCDETDP
jgi:hypothetical protein